MKRSRHSQPANSKDKHRQLMVQQNPKHVGCQHLKIAFAEVHLRCHTVTRKPLDNALPEHQTMTHSHQHDELTKKTHEHGSM